MRILLAILVVGLIAGGFYLYRNPSVVEPLVEGTPLESQTGSTALYRWRDGKGTLHITDQPPADGTPYEKVEYRHDTNVIAVPAELKKKD